MKMSVKIAAAMLLLTLIIIISGVFNIYQLDRVNQSSTDMAEKSLPAIVTAEDINKMYADYRIYEIQYVNVISDVERKNYATKLQEVNLELDKTMASFGNMTMTPAISDLFRQVQNMRVEYNKLHSELFQLANSGKREEALAFLLGSSRDLHDKIGTALNQIVKEEVAEGKRLSDAGDALFDSSLMTIIVVMVISVILGVASTIIVVRSTLAQLGKDPGDLMHIAERVTGGDYNIDDGSPKSGVYGSLVNMVDALKANILKAQEESAKAAEESRHALLSMEKAERAGQQAEAKTRSVLTAADKLEEVASVLSSASTQLTAQIEQSRRGASEQAARVTETATAMEEMNSTVMEVARSAGHAADSAMATRQRADAGAEVVTKAVHGIQSVQEQALRLKEDMTHLDENAQAISQIMGVISDIADQTNLLALNAAIEAARAGEAGRGFAVVADEVRKLAEKTMASTADVSKAIKAIQDSAKKSMGQMDTAVRTIEEATLFANSSGEALAEIVGMVDDAADQVRAIATASEEQSATSESINRSISEVNSIAGETAAAMGDASTAVNELARQAQVLSRLIEEMKRG